MLEDTKKSYYISSERRPLPETKRNTLYNFTHGLTEPGHEALTRQHIELQGIVDAHHSQQNAYAETALPTCQARRDVLELARGTRSAAAPRATARSTSPNGSASAASRSTGRSRTCIP